MSVGKKPSSPSRREEGKVEGEIAEGEKGSAARKGSSDGGKRYGRCFSGLEISIGPGPLRDVDAGRLKSQIRRWARAVVALARQLSFGSPRSSSRRMSGGGATAGPQPSLPSPASAEPRAIPEDLGRERVSPR